MLQMVPAQTLNERGGVGGVGAVEGLHAVADLDAKQASRAESLGAESSAESARNCCKNSPTLAVRAWHTKTWRHSYYAHSKMVQ